MGVDLLVNPVLPTTGSTGGTDEGGRLGLRKDLRRPEVRVWTNTVTLNDNINTLN